MSVGVCVCARLVEEMPIWVVASSSAYCRHEFWEPVEVDDGGKQSEKVGLGYLEIGLPSVRVSHGHHAQVDFTTGMLGSPWFASAKSSAK